MCIRDSLYNARQYAKNFGPDELREAVDYCHQNGVRVNLTVNTLYTDRELPGVLDYVRFLCSAGVDALIVQDLGLLSLLRRMAPGLPLHASTQMTIHNREGVELSLIHIFADDGGSSVFRQSGGVLQPRGTVGIAETPVVFAVENIRPCVAAQAQDVRRAGVKKAVSVVESGGHCI